MSRRGRKSEAFGHVAVGIYNLPVASEKTIREAVAATEGHGEPCKHGVRGPCQLCSQEDADHDAFMANQAENDYAGS